MLISKVHIKGICLLLVMAFFCSFISCYSNYSFIIDGDVNEDSHPISYSLVELIEANLDILNSSIVRLRPNSLPFFSTIRRCSKYLKFKVNTIYLSRNNLFSIYSNGMSKANSAKTLAIKNCNIEININWINMKDGKKKYLL